MKKLTFLLVIGVLITGIFWFYSSYLSSLDYVLNPDSDATVLINIEKGSSGEKIANLLYEKGLINNPTVFKLYLKQQGVSDQIKAGRLILQENFDLKKIVEALIEGRTSSVAVTLLEGWTAQQMADYMESLGLTTADEFMDCVENCSFESSVLPGGYLEGYLYPDTYFVDYATYDNRLFIQRLINTFEAKLSEEWDAIENNKHSLEEIIILASIVEREEHNSTQQPTVAGILWNRYDNGIGLGADATVLYALGRTSGGLSYEDLQVDNAYNTRKYRGLPPTPISNPGLSSILAAIYPKETDYFYYLHGTDGQVRYGRTLEEHNANKRKYL